MSNTDNKRKSERIAGKVTMPAAKEAKRPASKRAQWLEANQAVLEAAFDRLQTDLSEVREESKDSFTNFAAIVADELCPGVVRIYNDDSTDDEDDIDDLCSEDCEEESFEDDEETEDSLEEELSDLLEDDEEDEDESDPEDE